MILRFDPTTMLSIVYFGIKNRFMPPMSCVNSTPSLSTSTFKPLLIFTLLSLEPPSWKESENQAIRSRLQERAPPALRASISTDLKGRLSSVLTMENEMTASPELTFSPISNPDNGKIPLRSRGYLHTAG